MRVDDRLLALAVRVEDACVVEEHRCELARLLEEPRERLVLELDAHEVDGILGLQAFERLRAAVRAEGAEHVPVAERRQLHVREHGLKG